MALGRPGETSHCSCVGADGLELGAFPGPSPCAAEHEVGLLAAKRDGAVEEAASVVASEDPERVPSCTGARTTDVGVCVPPALAWVLADVWPDLGDWQRTDQEEARPCTVARVQAGHEEDGVARLGPPQAEGAAGSAAVVTIGRRIAVQIGVQVHGAPAPHLRQAQHRCGPWSGFGHGVDHKRAVVMHGRVHAMGRVDAHVGEEGSHGRDSRTMIAVIGGGYSGSYHARQLLKAVTSGRLAAGGLLVVDRDADCAARHEFAGAGPVSFMTADWLDFLRGWLRAASDSDFLIPAPLAPHLLWEWLAFELGATRLDPPRGWGLPYEQPGPGQELYLSAAAWTCPATCVEPAHCPVLHAPRDWDLADVIAAKAVALGFEPAILRCLHLASGVGGIRVRDIREATRRAAQADRVLVATSSRCHAAVGALGPGASR